MFDEIKFTEATRKLVDCAYSLGDTSKGYDCLSMLLRIYRDMGFQFPYEWRGWTEKNYAERWLKGEGRQEFIDFLSGLGTSVKPNFMRKGDVVIFERGPAIYVGNNHVLTLFNTGKLAGGKTFPISFIRDKIVDVRRLV